MLVRLAKLDDNLRLIDVIPPPRTMALQPAALPLPVLPPTRCLRGRRRQDLGLGRCPWTLAPWVLARELLLIPTPPRPAPYYDVKVERGENGRWTGKIANQPEVLGYGDTENEAGLNAPRRRPAPGALS